MSTTTLAKPKKELKKRVKQALVADEGSAKGLKIKDLAKSLDVDVDALKTCLAENSNKFNVDGKRVLLLKQEENGSAPIPMTEVEKRKAKNAKKEEKKRKREDEKAAVPVPAVVEEAKAEPKAKVEEAKAELTKPFEKSEPKKRKTWDERKEAKEAAPKRALVAWTPEEDNNLVKLHKLFGNQWTTIAKHLRGTRNFNDCRKRYESALDPTRSKGDWSEEEDASLKALVAEHGNDKWAVIAKELAGGNRTSKQCRIRWMNVLDPNVAKGDTPWSMPEDASLKELVEKKGDAAITLSVWAGIAKEKKGESRTGKQCKRRWSKFLDPNRPKTEITLVPIGTK